ncbi:MAG: ABC-F family ATP-binding cassette domain-containing protein [Planktomarina sp.]|jgi:ATP-binding cassette subfamily F protein uup|nr:ABC-F family ATP-binding cassette domain-containing protein [Planktomarina sp.]MDC3385777.1 ABC-F family ATP-binding cassette domain-containing protein [Planktomarina sp.]MDS9949908.1 ABC-F family ATP-binding cassette domain-containing protein [Planktomarina sp.]|tara:strand:+ start:6436 stop:8244 length:1809 start_codon:yes stop_codon:yes gene_type:complete
MARAPLIQLSNVALTFGGNPVFEDLGVIVQTDDRVSLVGRNGSGKSTLMKVMAGLVDADEGSRVIHPGVRVGYMEQDPDLTAFSTLGDYAFSDLDEADHYKVEIAAEGLKFDPDRLVRTASGGERRRAALAKLMAENPELMLLDEPTNHLDIEAISWLETTLRESRNSFVVISHDRTFLTELTRSTLWIDRGSVRRLDQGFGSFESWRDKVWEEEDDQRHKLNRKIKAESRWAVEGISARRKRNMGRVRALEELRAERASQIKRQSNAAMALDSGKKSGVKVIEAKNLSLAFGEFKIFDNLSLTVQRQDRIAIVGPNGVGKTTLINTLIGQQKPDSGTVKLGTNLKIAMFDQGRSQLDPALSLWEALTSDPSMAVSGSSDQIMVRGYPKHVVGYLKDFLFAEEQMRAPVRSLSGGEKARLILARLMAQESNFLILDEPTNDLDIETLDLLQDVLGQYDGTVLLVSHDRDFLDRVATTTIALEGAGKAIVYAGGWSDYQAQKPKIETTEPRKVNNSQKVERSKIKTQNNPITFSEKHQLKILPKKIERLEAEINKLEEFLSQPDLFKNYPVKFKKATEILIERQEKLSLTELEWLELAEKVSH